MKNDYLSIWKEAKWSFQAKRLIQGFNQFLRDAQSLEISTYKI